MGTDNRTRLTPDLPPLIEVPDLRLPGSEGPATGDNADSTESGGGDEPRAGGAPVSEHPD